MPDYNKLQDETTLLEYSDKFVKIANNKLKISTYYFPLGQAKIVDCSDILGIYYWSQNDKGQCFRVKSWGQSFSPCWWACDIKRLWFTRADANFNVAVLVNGDALYKGFSVTNIEEFLHIIRLLVEDPTIVQNKMPF